MLSKLYIPDKPGELPLLLLHMLLSDLDDVCPHEIVLLPGQHLTDPPSTQHPPFEDAVAEKLLDKIRTGLVKRFGRRIEGIDVSAYKENVRFCELRAFLELELEEDEEDHIGDRDRPESDVGGPEAVEEQEEGSEPEVGPASAALRGMGNSKDIVPVPSEVGSEEGFVPFYTMLVF